MAPSFEGEPHLPVKWRSSRSNNSATQATIYKQICVCESPRDKLCHKQNGGYPQVGKAWNFTKFWIKKNAEISRKNADTPPLGCPFTSIRIIPTKIDCSETPNSDLWITSNIMSKFEVSEFCRAFKFLDWGDGAIYAPWTLPPLFSTTTMIIDTNGTAYESLWIGLSDTSNIVAKLVLVAE